MVVRGQVHDAMSPIPATLPPEERKKYQHLILATYPHGRGTTTNDRQLLRDVSVAVSD